MTYHKKHIWSRPSCWHRALKTLRNFLSAECESAFCYVNEVTWKAPKGGGWSPEELTPGLEAGTFCPPGPSLKAPGWCLGVLTGGPESLHNSGTGPSSAREHSVPIPLGSPGSGCSLWPGPVLEGTSVRCVCEACLSAPGGFPPPKALPLWPAVWGPRSESTPHTQREGGGGD